MTAKLPAPLTDAQRAALKWLAEHNGDGTFTAHNSTFLAAGEIAPFMRSTFNRLAKLHLVLVYDKRRMKLTPLGKTLVEGFNDAH